MTQIPSGEPDHCLRCGQLKPASELIYEGPELEPICLACLQQIDPARAQVLSQIQKLRRPC